MSLKESGLKRLLSFLLIKEPGRCEEP